MHDCVVSDVNGIGMVSEYTEFKEKNAELQNVYKPVFFRLANHEDKQAFEKLIAEDLIFLHDELYDQLKELIKSRNPTRNFTSADYPELIGQHLSGSSADSYGVWVFYPWSRRVVHMLDEVEFIELRTAANKNKITTEERDLLATKKVGVIGLSVGQSVSLTLALERGCGELRLADFDTLELNNLNRIRTGVHNLGLLKAYAVAREIAEIDPFFKVVCYTEGITDDNIDDFFLKGGKLSAVIDECDGINIKILCRIKAKELQVPVLMEASDRATLDVERFDLHPDRPIMHGWLEHLTLDLDVLRNLKTNEEKIPYILPISGQETLSARMQASMIEMRNTLTTWPQLASAVTLGGALTADTCRRIFLDQYTDSGRYFIDLEQLVPDKRPKQEFRLPAAPMPLSDDLINAVAAQALRGLPGASLNPSRDDVAALVGAAVKAPSASNAQPWKWYFSQGYLFLFYDYTGVISFGDNGRIASYMAYGAALENLELKADSLKLKANVYLFPLQGNEDLIAAISFDSSRENTGLHNSDELVQQIDKRCTNRLRGANDAISADILDQLHIAVASVPGAKLTLITDKEKINEISGITGPAERLKLLNPASHFEFYNQELQWEDNDADAGVPVNALGISQPEIILLKMAKNPDVIKLLTEWKGGQALEYSLRSATNTASAIGLISMPGHSSTDYIAGGRAMERMWLTATKNNIAVHPLMTSLFFFARLTHHNGDGLPEVIKSELRQLNERFRIMIPESNDRECIFLFKIGTASPIAHETSRRPLEEVLLFK